MRFSLAKRCALGVLALWLEGCGAGVSQLPEPWDRFDPDATYHLEVQIKRAIFCELRDAAIEARRLNQQTYIFNGRYVTKPDDVPFANSWGAQITMTLTADEKSTLAPGATLKTPLIPGTPFKQTVSQGFGLGLGATFSTENVRYDKYDFYYTASDLIEGADQADVCPPDTSSEIKAAIEPPSRSSPFLNASGLGIREWLPTAVGVSIFNRSSRAAKNGEGPALGSGGSFTSDSATYDNKFVLVSDGSITPSWNLVRVATNTTPFFDENRTRTHELLITIGPGATESKTDKKTGKKVLANVGPSASALNSHFASQIGSSLAAALGH